MILRQNVSLRIAVKEKEESLVELQSGVRWGQAPSGRRDSVRRILGRQSGVRRGRAPVGRKSIHEE